MDGINRVEYTHAETLAGHLKDAYVHQHLSTHAPRRLTDHDFFMMAAYLIKNGAVGEYQ